MAGALAWPADTAKSALDAAQAALAGGDYARAIEQAEQAAATYHSQHDLPNEGIAANVAGSAYLHRGDYELALQRYQTALQLDRQLHDAAGEITRLTNIGSVYFFRGRYLEALEEYLQALQRGGGQLVFTNLATLYEQLGENQKALDYYQQALALGPSGELLTSLGNLYRHMGEAAKALESYRAAEGLYAQEHKTPLLEDIGRLQAMDLHDPNAALASFDQAVKLAKPRDTVLAHLFRGEALYRMKRGDAAADDFRAAGENWMALYRLGRIAEAVAAIESTRDAPPKSDFLPGKREVYDAAIALQLQAGTPDPKQLFGLLERAHESPADPPPLQAVQARLAAGSMLIEYWKAGRAALWVTRDRAGIGTDFPLAGITELLVVLDGEMQSPFAGRYAISYLPYASFLVRDEPWRTPLMPWRQRRLAVTTKRDLYSSEAPLIIFNTRAVADANEPNRSHIVLSPTESLFRGEIQSLPLARTDLVVLPAADPAQVLSRAFLAAGARSTLTTRWTVPENRAAMFLRVFYNALSDGRSKAQALQVAKAADPEAGAAFILTGDGQQPTRPVLSWIWVIGPAIGAAGVIILLRRR